MSEEMFCIAVGLNVTVFLIVSIAAVNRLIGLNQSLLYEIRELNHLLREKEGTLAIPQPMPSRPKA